MLKIQVALVKCASSVVDKYIFTKPYLCFIYRQPSLFAVMVFAVLTIRGFENLRKPRIAREINDILTLFRFKLLLLVFAGLNFSRTKPPRIKRAACTHFFLKI